MAGFIVAIDGAAGSGKSTTARGVAKRLDFFYLDTGAMYRAFTLKYLQGKKTGIGETVIKRLLQETRIRLEKEGDEYHTYLDGQNVSLKIREPEVNRFVSQISAIPEVREWMVYQQRQIAKDKNVVCEGRDIGTVVFPDAQVKIFMKADIEVRARRRKKELLEKNINVDLDEVIENLKFRDQYDSTRKHSPLRVARDAVIVDTTNLTIEQEIDLIEKIVKARLKNL